MADGNVALAEGCWQCAGSVLAACWQRACQCAGVVARCECASVADLLVAAWLMSTAAAGVFEAKKMQKMLLLPQLCRGLREAH